MFDDDAARRALQALTDEPAPPARTTVEQVLRRGRRRVFAQRASAVAGVVAVVAVIGVGAVLLRPGGVQVADGSTTNVPASTQSSMPLPGWRPVSLPADTQTSKGNCMQQYVELPPEADVPLVSLGRAKEAFIGATEAIAGKALRASNSTWLPNSEKHEAAPRGYINIAVAMDNGIGQIQLEAARYGGTPEQVANASITVYGQCGKPFRRTLDDGTVLQLYPLDTRDAVAPSQHLQIYRPDGRSYIVTSAGWSENDMVPIDGGSGGMTLGGGRGKVPVTEAQLAAIGERLVTNLE
jgi:hypothetical protein